MTEIRFPYFKYLVTAPDVTPKEHIYRPVIPVRLQFQDQAMKFHGLIDSGADENTFPGWVAERLGHDVHRGEKKIFSGIGGSVLAYRHKTTLNITEIKLTVDVYYSNEWNDMPFGLLGQAGFFAHFDVRFDYKNKFISLKH